MKVGNVNILETIKELYPEIEQENNEAKLTTLVNQILSNIKTLNPNNLKISEVQVKACIMTTVNKAHEILDK